VRESVVEKPSNEQLIQSFKSFVNENIEKYNQSSSHVFNMDQTPVWFNMTPHRIVNPIGSKKTRAKVAGSNLREKLSVCLTVRMDGLKLPPLLVIKSAGKVPIFDKIGDIYICKNPKTSMMSSELVSKWLEILFPSEDTLDTPKRLLIMDSFRGHLTDQVKQTCDSLNIIRAIIPGGLTSELQPLDKNHLRNMRNGFNHKPQSIKDQHFTMESTVDDSSSFPIMVTSLTTNSHQWISFFSMMMMRDIR